MRYLLVLLLFSLCCCTSWGQNFERLRRNMVNSQIEGRGITHKPTLKAMGKVERHLFVPSGQRGNAYDDGPVQIGYGQTISQPYIVAFMTALVDPQPHHRVLEIGTGSGYQAAVLAEMVDRVFTIEIVPELGERSRNLLSELRYDNVQVTIADGYHGLEAEGPFDAIVVTAAAEHIPPPLIEQLKEGGKMIIPVGSPFMVQSLILVEKKEGQLYATNQMLVRFVPFTRAE